MRWSGLISFTASLLNLSSVCSNILRYDKTLFEGAICATSDTQQGICSSNCNTLTPAQKRDTKNRCSFVKNETIFCCPKVLLNSSVFYPTIAQACLYREHKLEERHQMSGELKKLNKKRADQLEQIGRDVNEMILDANREGVVSCEEEGRLIGGKAGEYYLSLCRYLEMPYTEVAAPSLYPAQVEEYPHMAALGWVNPDKSISWNCGATLVHRSFVLTAAHCIQNIGKPPDLVRVGDVDLRQTSDDKITVEYHIEKIFIHEEYRPPSFYNDIALLKIKKTPEFRFKLRPVPACIWTKDDYPSQQLLLLGYGAPAFGQAHNEKLYKGNLTILAHEVCTAFYEPSNDLPNGIIENQICAWDLEGKLDTCEGDSGGPLQFSAGDKWKTPYLVGITSFGVLCLDGNPGIYTKVHDFLGWIENVMKENQ